MDLDVVAPRLSAGGVIPDGEDWWFEHPARDHHLANATTTWVVPFTPAGDTVAVNMSSGRHHIPGGTIEPGENWQDGAERELWEELGAQVLEIRPFGAIVTSRKVRLATWAEITDPTGPEEPDRSGNYVEALVRGEVAAIVALLERDDQGVLADLYRVADRLRVRGFLPIDVDDSFFAPLEGDEVAEWE